MGEYKCDKCRNKCELRIENKCFCCGSQSDYSCSMISQIYYFELCSKCLYNFYDYLPYIAVYCSINDCIDKIKQEVSIEEAEKHFQSLIVVPKLVVVNRAHNLTKGNGNGDYHHYLPEAEIQIRQDKKIPISCLVWDGLPEVNSPNLFEKNSVFNMACKEF